MVCELQLIYFYDKFDTISEIINRNKEKYREKERGCINMCKAIEDRTEELKAEGEAEGVWEGKI